jgi:hypothetical protein
MTPDGSVAGFPAHKQSPKRAQEWKRKRSRKNGQNMDKWTKERVVKNGQNMNKWTKERVIEKWTKMDKLTKERVVVEKMDKICTNGLTKEKNVERMDKNGQMDKRESSRKIGQMDKRER